MSKAGDLLQLFEGHSTVIFFAATPDYSKALKMLDDKKSEDRAEYGNQESLDSWAHAHAPKKVGKEFDTKDAAYDWLEENVDNYKCFAVKVKTPDGWMFGADVHA